MQLRTPRAFSHRIGFHWIGYRHFIYIFIASILGSSVDAGSVRCVRGCEPLHPAICLDKDCKFKDVDDYVQNEIRKSMLDDKVLSKMLASVYRRNPAAPSGWYQLHPKGLPNWWPDNVVISNIEQDVDVSKELLDTEDKGWSESKKVFYSNCGPDASPADGTLTQHTKDEFESFVEDTIQHTDTSELNASMGGGVGPYFNASVSAKLTSKTEETHHTSQRKTQEMDNTITHELTPPLPPHSIRSQWIAVRTQYYRYKLTGTITTDGIISVRPGFANDPYIGKWGDFLEPAQRQQPIETVVRVPDFTILVKNDPHPYNTEEACLAAEKTLGTISTKQ
jgi:hypothetical protein